MMKPYGKYLVAFSIIFLALFSTVQAQDTVEKKFKGILADMSAAVSSSKNEDVKKIFAAAMQRISSDELGFFIDEKAERSIFQGIGFTPPKGRGKPCYVVLSPYMLEIYSKRPSIVMTALFHEFVHAYDYFRDPPAFLNYSKDPLERFMYEFDATYFEAVFIESVPARLNYDLSKFERYLMDCFRKKELHVFSRYLLGTDYYTAFELYRIRNSRKTAEEKLMEVQSLGKAVLEKNTVRPEDGREKIFEKCMAMLTFRNYAPRTVTEITDSALEKAAGPGLFLAGKYQALNGILASIDRTTYPYLKLCDDVLSGKREEYGRID
ncbi:MAG: hypothetical protein MUD12_16535 [Spirochaetes bacterium]|jgi:hypothetical protein|nr:hypothetical protein [Spirochaetota bacterium]